VNSFAPGTDPYSRIFGGYANGGGGIARGVELSGRFSPGVNTRLQASYTFVNSDSRIPTIAGTSYYSILDLSPHVFTVTATHWLTRQTNVTFDMAAHSDYTLTLSGGGARQFRFSGPIKGDLMVRHDLHFSEDHTVEIYGKFENVFNQRAYEDGYIGPKAWFITGARFAF
jgi:vitamin B12 transporter